MAVVSSGAAGGVAAAELDAIDSALRAECFELGVAFVGPGEGTYARERTLTNSTEQRAVARERRRKMLRVRLALALVGQTTHTRALCGTHTHGRQRTTLVDNARMRARGARGPMGAGVATQAGTIKMNIDTDTQWAYWDGIRQYEAANHDYLQGQIGNPESPTKPNKKYYDPRMAMRSAEETMRDRLCEAAEDLNCVQVL